MISKIRSVRQKSSAEGVTEGKFYRPPAKRESSLSILQRRKKAVPDNECLTAYEIMEQYKDAADKLHSSLIYVLVENPLYAQKLSCVKIPDQIQYDPSYKYMSDYLAGTFVPRLLQGQKGKYESLDLAIKACKVLHEEQNRYIRTQLEALKPLTTFVGEDYWEFEKLKRIYQFHLEKYDTAYQANSKQNNADTMKVVKSAQVDKDSARNNLMALITKINKNKKTVAECVIKFAKVAVEWHRYVAKILVTLDKKGQQTEIRSVLLPAPNRDKSSSKSSHCLFRS
uniref:Uncharacterized protein n=1 Tax=Caenorhabditis japonica TaxID=281687 RepID=A0A8R1HW45_CAEJA